jgi:hypothetical protein
MDPSTGRHRFIIGSSYRRNQRQINLEVNRLPPLTTDGALGRTRCCDLARTGPSFSWSIAPRVRANRHYTSRRRDLKDWTADTSHYGRGKKEGLKHGVDIVLALLLGIAILPLVISRARRVSFVSRRSMRRNESVYSPAASARHDLSTEERMGMNRRGLLTTGLALLLLTGICATPAAAQSFGLEWPGDGSVRRMLYWDNPFPIYDATYIFRVFPREKIVPTNSPTGYYTTFFWGNNGLFTWDGGGIGNTYYGAHPYPMPAPDGVGQWEISVWSSDFVTGTEVEWNRWHTQVFRAWRESPTVAHHEFYWDWPDTTKVIIQTVEDDPSWADRNPPNPAIVIGQAPDLCGPPPDNCGLSWGGSPGWEEFNGIIRGVQIYSGLLSLSDVQAEIDEPESSEAGRSLIWYLNLDPRPSDVTDKKTAGPPNDALWDGTTAEEWSDAANPSPSAAPNVRRR